MEHFDWIQSNQSHLISIDLPFLAKAWRHVLRLHLGHEVLFVAEHWRVLAL